MFRLLALLFCLMFAMHRASAVVVAQSNDPLYTQPPASDDFGFSSVGIVPNAIGGIPASGVYIGDGWVLSAYHNVVNSSGEFTFGTVVFGGIGYTVDAGTARRLHTPVNGPADLAMFRLTEEPTVLSASLSGTTPTATTAVRMMGNGQDRDLTETQWDVDGNNPWVKVESGGDRVGYELIQSRTMRWGTNQVDSGGLSNVSSTYGTTRAFRMEWNPVSGEGMATGGDSGGGVFVKNAGQWQLAGIMFGVPPLPGQPAGTVAYGNVTFAANIATYRAEIELNMATVPEPSAALLLLSGVALLPRRRGRRV